MFVAGAIEEEEPAAAAEELKPTGEAAKAATAVTWVDLNKEGGPVQCRADGSERRLEEGPDGFAVVHWPEGTVHTEIPNLLLTLKPEPKPKAKGKAKAMKRKRKKGAKKRPAAKTADGAGPDGDEDAEDEASDEEEKTDKEAEGAGEPGEEKKEEEAAATSYYERKWNKPDNKLCILKRIKKGPPPRFKQLFQFGSKDKTKEQQREIGAKAIDKLKAGESPGDVKVWANAECAK